MGNTKNLHQNQESQSLKLLIVKVFLALYGIITFPVYFLIQQPWRTWNSRKRIWAKHKIENDPYSPLKRVDLHYSTSLEGIYTVDQFFRNAVKRHGNKKCLGARRRLYETEEYDKTGKIFKKLQLGDYHWLSYAEAEENVEYLSKGLLAMGLRPKQTVVIFAETRREWFLTLQACLRNNISVATLYATLGDDGIVHGINETEVSTIITSQDLLPKLKTIANKFLTMNTIIYMENTKKADTNGFPSNIIIHTLSEIERMGEDFKSPIEVQPPSPEDLAVIMYTNGSTGIPKGVLMTHENLLTALVGLDDIIADWNEFNTIMAYLPLAHVYEMMTEFLFFHIGIKIGYSSPLTMIDHSTGLMKGCKGDVTVLQPTIMCTVPLILERIRKGVFSALDSKEPFAKEFFNYAVEYKKYWWEKGFNCPILNRIVFKKVQQILGEKMEFVICAGAHLSLDIQSFVRNCFDVEVLQVYGITETTACGAAMGPKDFSTGRVGGPPFPCNLKLVDWEEGNYRPTDKPHPRGEIVLGGKFVAAGYFKNQELTKEVFKEEDGIRWFYTGDIGEIFPDGTLKIIDRKKDLQKLQRGEYVSLGKIEAEMKLLPLIDNICVVCSNVHDYLAALIVPNVQQLRKLATTLCREHMTLRELCQDKDIMHSFMELFTAHGKRCGLMKHEIPQKVTLCSEEWLPETGFVTAALKIRRKPIENYYKVVINDMFNGATYANGKI